MLYKTLISLQIYTKTPNTRDFRHKILNYSVFKAEYTENSGYSMIFFRKIGKITILHTKLISSIKFVGRKLRKIGIFAKTSNVLKSFSLQLVAQDTIVEHTKNSHNSHLYTNSEKFSPIVSKIWHFLKCHNNCYSNRRKVLTHKNLKEQLTPHTSIVKRIAVSVTNMHLSSSNALLCQLVPQTHKLLKQLKPTDIAN